MKERERKKTILVSGKSINYHFFNGDGRMGIAFWKLTTNVSVVRGAEEILKGSIMNCHMPISGCFMVRWIPWKLEILSLLKYFRVSATKHLHPSELVFLPTLSLCSNTEVGLPFFQVFVSYFQAPIHCHSTKH